MPPAQMGTLNGYVDSGRIPEMIARSQALQISKGDLAHQMMLTKIDVL